LYESTGLFLERFDDALTILLVSRAANQLNHVFKVAIEFDSELLKLMNMILLPSLHPYNIKFFIMRI